MTSTVTTGSIVVTTDSLQLDQLEDVIIGTEAHNEYVTFNDNAIDGAYVDGWVPKSHILEDNTNVNTLTVPDHNDLFVWNNVTQDANFASDWVNKKITDLIQGLQVTVEGIVAIENAKTLGRDGNPGLSDMVAFTDFLINSVTLGIGSSGDNNAVYKREPTDNDFIYLTTMSLGEIQNFDLPAGTVFRSTKGICGFTSPSPMPFGVASMSASYFRFYAFRGTSEAFVTSAGLESVVTLYSADGITVVDGPVTLEPFGSATLECGDAATGEFVITATNDVYTGTKTTDNRDQRIVPPMALEIIVWNRFNRVTAQESGTLVRWYRQNMETGSVTVDAGTPQNIYNGTINEDAGGIPENAGSTEDYAEDGCLILRADKPIGCFSGADGAGSDSTPGWPLNQLAQLFPNPANVDDQLRADQSSVTIGSQYEGTMFVYDSTKTLITSIAITRGTVVATTDDQLYPAAAQWQPLDSGITDWYGGFVITNVPAICIMNLRGDSVFTADNGDELIIVGTTPEDIRAEIIVDASGFRRRRDVDALGVETFVIC